MDILAENCSRQNSTFNHDIQSSFNQTNRRHSCKANKDINTNTLSFKSNQTDEYSTNFYLKDELQIDETNVLTINTSSISSGYSSITSVSSSLTYFSEYNLAGSRESIETASLGRFSLGDEFFNQEILEDDLFMSSPKFRLNSQTEIISEICVEIDTFFQSSKMSESLKVNRQFWNYLLTKLDLLGLLNNSQQTNLFYSSEKYERLLSLRKLFLCLSEIEKSLDLSFETLLSLSFLFYEQINHIICTNFILNNDFNMIFELDINLNVSNHQSIIKFEEYLNYYLHKFISLQFFSHSEETKIVDFIRNLFDKELNFDTFFLDQQNDSYLPNENLLDITSFLSRPETSSEHADFLNSNPITQSYKGLIENLHNLNLISSDPFREATEAHDLYGRQMDQLSYACFNLSFYTMGYFKSPNNLTLFDSHMNCLYEMNSLNFECEKIFKSEPINEEWKSRMLDSLGGNYELYLSLFESCEPNRFNRSKNSSFSSLRNQFSNLKPASTKWNFTLLPEPKTPVKKSNSNRVPIFDEIMNRISSLNTHLLFNKYFQIAQNCGYISMEQKPTSETKNSQNTSNSRSWTVAPKLFSINTTGSCSSKHRASNADTMPTASMIDDFSNNKTAPNRPMPRPIGSKPMSMLTNNRYNNRGKFVQIGLMKGSLCSSQTKTGSFMNEFKNSTMWKIDESYGSEYTSPFFFLSTTETSLNDFAQMSQKIQTSQSYTVIIKRTSGSDLNEVKTKGDESNALNLNEQSKVKKYSVAPLSMLNSNKFNSCYTNNNNSNNSFRNRQVNIYQLNSQSSISISSPSSIKNSLTNSNSFQSNSNVNTNKPHFYYSDEQQQETARPSNNPVQTRPARTVFGFDNQTRHTLNSNRYHQNKRN